MVVSMDKHVCMYVCMYVCTDVYVDDVVFAAILN